MTSLRQGLVALLGDSAHAMQPNLGQGGCMAIEDGYQLATDLAAAVQDAQGRSDVDMERVLQNYQVRCVSAVRGGRRDVTSSWHASGGTQCLRAHCSISLSEKEL